LSAFCAALVAIFGKIGLKGIDSSLATTIRSIVMSLFLILFVFFVYKISSVDNLYASVSRLPHKNLLFIILSGLAGAASWLFYFHAIKQGPVTGVVAVDKLSVAIAIVLAAVFLGETITAKIALGGVMIALGAFLVAM